MQQTNQNIQTFPAISIEPLASGHLRLKDMSGFSDDLTIDLHPVQVQTLAVMIGCTLPDRTRKALTRLQQRLNTLTQKARELESQLTTAVCEDGIEVAPELISADFLALGLTELAQDLADLTDPELEQFDNPKGSATGQLSLPV